MGMNEGKLIGDPSLSINLNGASVSVCLIETLDLSRILNFLVDLAGRVSLMAFTLAFMEITLALEWGE